MLTAFAGGTTFGARHGTGAPWILALHGWGRTHADFAAALTGLDAIAVDLAGFGATPAPPAAWSTSEYASHLAPVLDEMADHVVVVGHSFGGRVAVHLAGAHHDRLGALVLTGVPLVRDPDRAPAKPPFEMRVAKVMRRLGMCSETKLDVIRQRHGSPDYRAAEGVMRTVLVKAVNETYEDALARVRCPIEMVWGSDDTAAPRRVAELAVALAADARLEVLEGVDHFVPTRRPDALRAAVERHRP